MNVTKTWPRPPGRGEAGLSLVEALVAIALFGVALLGLNTLLVTTMRTSEFARDHVTARFLAAHRLEQIKNSRYQDGDRDAWNNTSDPCTDIDEITATNFPDEDYGAVDLLNGTRFTFRSCSNQPDIKNGTTLFTRASYPSDAQGNHDFWVNHGQYTRFRREVYIINSASYANAIRTVELDGPNPTARDNVTVNTVAPTTAEPASNYVKYVLVRVKWRDSHGHPHEVTMSTEKAFYIPAF